MSCSLLKTLPAGIARCCVTSAPYWGLRDYGVEGQLVTLQVYTQEAMVAWTKSAGDDKALDALRKVAAIAVRALEQYGCPRRGQ